MARILIVDDERDVPDLIRAILEEENHRVDMARNGSEALKTLGVEPPDAGAALPDLVLLDVMMPIVDGYTVSVKMLECERTRAVPVLVMTAHGDMTHLFRDARNVVGFLHKPFEARDLLDKVESALAR